MTIDNSNKKRLTAKIQKPRIIKSFYETIIAEGFDNASIAKVAKRLDIHPTLILHYFGNKENMTLALVDFVIESYWKIFKKLRDQHKHKNPDERLQAFCKTIWSRPYYEKINIAGTFSVLSVGFRNPRIKKKITYLYEEYTVLLVKELKELAKLGAIEKNDFHRTAKLLISMAEGARHFHPFLIRAKDLTQYNRDMTTAVIILLKSKPDHYT